MRKYFTVYEIRADGKNFKLGKLAFEMDAVAILERHNTGFIKYDRLIVRTK